MTNGRMQTPPADEHAGADAFACPTAMPLRGAIERANGDQVAILDAAHIAYLQSHESLRLARRRHELDLEPIGLVDLDDRTEVPAAQAVLREIPVEHDGFEWLELHV